MKRRAFANDRLRLSVTSACNFTCPYCTNEGQVHNRVDFLDLGFVDSLARWIKAFGIYVRKLNLTGGEPLLHPNLMKIVQAAVGCSESVTINTNGELLTRELIREFCDAGVKNIKFGIDSLYQPATKPFLKARSTTHPEKIMDSLLYARDLMPRSSLNIVVTDFNISEVDSLFRFVINNRLNYVEFIELIPFDFRQLGHAPPPLPRLSSLIVAHRNYFSKVTYNPRLAKYICTALNGTIVQFAEDFCLLRTCQNLWTRINAQGELLPCIKTRDSLKIDFECDLISQISLCNKLMCNGPDRHIPRDYAGQLVPSNQQGPYWRVSSFENLGMNVELTSLDP
jgi:cyclic pyranopterin phosphate synthase